MDVPACDLPVWIFPGTGGEGCLVSRVGGFACFFNVIPGNIEIIFFHKDNAVHDGAGFCLQVQIHGVAMDGVLS